MNEQTNSIWTVGATAPAADGAGRTPDDVAEWRTLTGRVSAMALARGWSKAEVARQAGMADGTFNQWFSGSYRGRLDTTNTRIRQWLQAIDEMEELAHGIPTSPGFVQTRTAREILETLTYAQMLPEMAVITLAAGMGKSFACRHYCASRPHAYLVTMSPNTKTVHAMLVEISASLGITQHNPARLHRAIGDRLQRNGRKTLLVVDEAQNLVDGAIDQLRSFLDINECGIALVGNEEIYDRFKSRQTGPSYAQIKRRIGKRLRRLNPYAEDVAAIVDAWEITDEASRKLLFGIGQKPGALGQIDTTLRLAGMLAAGAGDKISEKHIRRAWTNRGDEE